MNDICTLDPGTACIVGKLITKDVLHGGTKRVGGPWSLGRSLLSQSKEVHKNCKKALGCGRKCLDADGFVKSGNHQRCVLITLTRGNYKLIVQRSAAKSNEFVKEPAERLFTNPCVLFKVVKRPASA
jgi:hypothetical protein